MMQRAPEESPTKDEAAVRKAIYMKQQDKYAKAKAANAEFKARVDKENEHKAQVEAEEWSKTKALLQARAEEERRSLTTKDDAALVLDALGKLANKAAEAEEHAKRADRLAKVMGEQSSAAMKKRARRNSRDLQDEMAHLMDHVLEAAFAQFDADRSGALDAEELTAAFKAAKLPCTDDVVRKAIKLLDTNGDGLIDLAEFKEIAVKVQMMNAH